MNNILIIGVHYDDTELGAGGSATVWKNQGKNVYKMTLTDNVTDFLHCDIHVDFESSAASSRKACKILGIEEISDFKPCECSKLVYNKEMMQIIEDRIYDKKIDTVIMHYDHDMNQDHIEAAKLCLTAARHCHNILQYQSNGYVCGYPFEPNFFVDISECIALKKEALKQYPSEHNRFNRLFDTVMERNHVWGYANKVEYAEGFRVVKLFDEF